MGSQERAVLYDGSEANTWTLGYHKFPHFPLSSLFISGFDFCDILTGTAIPVWIWPPTFVYDMYLFVGERDLLFSISGFTTHDLASGYLPLFIYTCIPSVFMTWTHVISLVARTAVSFVYVLHLVFSSSLSNLIPLLCYFAQAPKIQGIRVRASPWSQ